MAMINPRPINLVAQLLQLRTMFPNSTGSVYKGTLRWKCEIQPTVICHSYIIELTYKFSSFPVVNVIGAPWRVLGAKHPPHIYADGSLCLFYPKAREFNGTMILARTIVPWASEWLMFYELWLASDGGEWLGGGTQH